MTGESITGATGATRDTGDRRLPNPTFEAYATAQIAATVSSNTEYVFMSSSIVYSTGSGGSEIQLALMFPNTEASGEFGDAEINAALITFVAIR